MTGRSGRCVVTDKLPPSDLRARQDALDPERSFIVQAPAGSGKTELLIQRILGLLTTVQKPEEVLAITFTRKAAAEMQDRLLAALVQASTEPEPVEDYRRQTWQRARRVLQQDQRLDWNLIQNPSRLQIMTIDSFCSSLSRQMPWLARLGEQPGIAEDAEALYRQAAENLLLKLESDSPASRHIETVLRQIDNHLVNLRSLIISMLAKRDQWIRHIIYESDGSRGLLEESLGRYVDGVISDCSSLFGPELRSELTAMALYAAENLDAAGGVNSLTSFIGYGGDLTEGGLCRAQWVELSGLLLTGKGQLRKQVTVRDGFPADKTEPAARMKERMLALLEQLASDASFLPALQWIRKLPDSQYQERQWLVLQSLVRLLPLAVIELREVFRAAGQIDFIEVAGSARLALGSVETPEDLLLQLDATINHILVDEYQDTSYTQYDLLQKLTAGWQPDDGRTLFIVGDPMQSIYRFREADVGLFLKAVKDGIGPVRLEPLALSSNFRSQGSLVAWHNRTFAPLFAPAGDILTGAVPYTRATEINRHISAQPVHFTCFAGRDDASEAEKILAIIRTAQDRDPDGSIAILVRSRNHLEETIKILKKNSIHYQAQDLDQLGDRPVAHDLAALTRALLHPADNVAWFSVLRAPWCGVSLNDLLVLSGENLLLQRILSDQPQFEMFETLSAEGTRALSRLRQVVNTALDKKGRVGLRQLVESTWLQLGGPAVLDQAGLADAARVFNLLDELDYGGGLESFESLADGLRKLFASPDPLAGPQLQIMTIHKAKGLEFDTVIVPGLGRPPRGDDKQLLRWLEHPDYGLMLAPVPPAGDDEDDIYRAIGDIQKLRASHETLRLFYVAATRARNELHLLGHVRESGGEFRPEANSLLDAIWPTVEDSVEIITTEPQADAGIRNAVIRRLSPDWQLPEMPDAVDVTDRSTITASEIGDKTVYASSRFSLRSEEGRIIGTTVHSWLEKAARHGLTESCIEKLPPDISSELNIQGIPADRLQPCTDRVISCLRNTLASERGRWILGNHRASESELELSGMINNQLVHASVDRTFIDDDIRWVIDYKTSAPGKGMQREDFLDNEVEAYETQIRTYMDLFRCIDIDREIRGALYFPAIDAWREVT